MKVHDTLKELLEDFAKFIMNDTEDEELKYDINKFLGSNSLALGKPEPLAKNKQTESICCDLIKHNYSINKIGRCIPCDKIKDTNTKDATSR